MLGLGKTFGSRLAETYQCISREFAFYQRRRVQKAYKAAEDLVAWLNRHRATIVVNCGRDGRFSVRAKGSVQPDAFHGIMHNLLISFRRVLHGEFANVWEMLFAFVREIVIKQLSELFRINTIYDKLRILLTTSA